MKRLIFAPLVAAALVMGAAAPAAAASNDQNGLVNVNLQGLSLAIPVSVALPIGVAANVCDVSVLSIQEQTGPATCDAKNTSTALSNAIARAIAGG
jgi:hypothetical protein